MIDWVPLGRPLAPLRLAPSDLPRSGPPTQQYAQLRLSCGAFKEPRSVRVKWSLRTHSHLSRAMSRLRWSIENRGVLDKLEWHRWFAWYPVAVAREDDLTHWAWLQFVERKTHWSRSTGEWVVRYR